MMLGARTAAWAKSGGVKPYIGLDAKWCTPVFDHEGLPFEYVGNCKTGFNWRSDLRSANRFFNSGIDNSYRGPFGVHKAVYTDAQKFRYFFTIRYDTDKNILSYMSQWDDNTETVFKFSFDGTRFELNFYENGSWIQKASVSSSLRVISEPLRFVKCKNSGWSWDHPYLTATAGSFDLSRCYIVKNGNLWWEGVEGAYRNVNG